MGIIVGFSTPKKWNPLSWAIRKLTKSEASHAWLLVDDPVFGVRMVMDAHLTGLRLIPFERFVEASTVIALAVPRWGIENGLAVQAKGIGSKYDLIGLAGVAYVKLMWILFKKKVTNPLRSPGVLFCSEAVTIVLQESLYPGAEVMDPESVAPGDLMAFFETSSECDYVTGDRLKL